jgi:hypothetical protein
LGKNKSIISFVFLEVSGSLSLKKAAWLNYRAALPDGRAQIVEKHHFDS